MPSTWSGPVTTAGAFETALQAGGLVGARPLLGPDADNLLDAVKAAALVRHRHADAVGRGPVALDMLGRPLAQVGIRDKVVAFELAHCRLGLAIGVGSRAADRDRRLGRPGGGGGRGRLRPDGAGGRLVGTRRHPQRHHDEQRRDSQIRRAESGIQTAPLHAERIVYKHWFRKLPPLLQLTLDDRTPRLVQGITRTAQLTCRCRTRGRSCPANPRPPFRR